MLTIIRGNGASVRDTLRSMRVRVLFFGVLKEIAGKSADEIDVRDGASVRDVLLHH